MEAKSKFRSLSLRTASIIAVIAITTNILSSILLNKNIGLSNLLVHLALLLVGIGGISSSATWQEVKKTSFLLMKFDEKNKNSAYNSAP